MFLFKRRKDPSENKKVPLDLAKTVKSQGNEKTDIPTGNSEVPTSGHKLPVTVIPASALKEELPAEAAASSKAELPKETVPEAVADALLVKVSREEPAEAKKVTPPNLTAAKPEKSDKPVSPVGTSPVKIPEPKPETAKKGNETEGKESLFSNLFGQAVEAEETPLDRLIKALPEISMEEVLNEAEEVKGLMNEWSQQQQK